MERNKSWKSYKKVLGYVCYNKKQYVYNFLKPKYFLILKYLFTKIVKGNIKKCFS